ncbi:MAG: hypothetical protein ABWY77_06225 [Acidimicrobiia bacterium]
MIATRIVRIVIGALIVFVGLVWVGQGIGWIEGSFMTGDAVWAVIGAVCIVIGGVVVASAFRWRPSD